MDFRSAIDRKIEDMTDVQLAQVLKFVASLTRPVVRGENGSALRAFAFSLDPVSAQEMIEAIDEGCERVVAGEW